MAEKKIFTKEQLAKAQEIASAGGTRQQITDYLKVNRAVVDRLLREKVIFLTPSPKNSQGQKYNWTEERVARLKEMYASDRYSVEEIAAEFGVSESPIVRKARELKLKKVRKAFWQPEDDQFLRDNIKKVSSILELSKLIGKTEDVVATRLKFLGIYDQRPIKTRGSEIREKLFANPEFVKQFGDPTYSHARLSKIWGVSDCTINKWRRQKFGSWQGLNDTYRGKTTAEMAFEEILRELDLAFIYEYKVGKWKNDYYLGQHIIVEVQGEYWHKAEKVMAKDRRKKADLELKGYTMVYVKEKELHSKLGRAAIKARILKVMREKFKL